MIKYLITYPNFLFIIWVVLATSCQKFEPETATDTFIHLEVDGAELPIWIKGNTASGNIVVFINGGPGLTSIDIATADMLGWGERLEKEIAMVYYDQRGTGNAQGNLDQESITLSQYLIDLKRIVQFIGIKYPEASIFLMGHSFGGFIGQQFLLDQANQDMISGWININGSTIIDPEKEWVYRLQFLSELAREKLPEDSLKWAEALEWIENNNPIETSDQKNEWRAFIGFPGEDVLPDEIIELPATAVLRILFASSYNLFPAYLSSNLNVVSDILYEDVKGTDLLPELYRIKLPVLTLWGKYDDIIPPQLGKAAFDSLGTIVSEKSFRLFYESGHQPFINEAAKFESAVIDFINQH